MKLGRAPTTLARRNIGKLLVGACQPCRYGAARQGSDQDSGSNCNQTRRECRNRCRLPYFGPCDSLPGYRTEETGPFSEGRRGIRRLDIAEVLFEFDPRVKRSTGSGPGGPSEFLQMTLGLEVRRNRLIEDSLMAGDYFAGDIFGKVN